MPHRTGVDEQTDYPRQSRCRVLLLLATPAVACPGHSSKSHFSDWPIAGFAHAVAMLVDPAQCVFDSSQKSSVGTVQLNLEFRLGINICFVDRISLDAPRCQNHRPPTLARSH